MSALPDYDTGPLNWVRGDIDAALQAALGRIPIAIGGEAVGDEPDNQFALGWA